MDKLLDILPEILLAIGQLMQTLINIRQQKEIDDLWEFQKTLLKKLREDHGTKE